MLLEKFLETFKRYNSNLLKSNEKEIIILIFMILTKVNSIRDSKLQRKYLQRIYRYFNRIESNNLEILPIFFEKTTEEILSLYSGYSKFYKKKNPLIISIDDSVIEKYGHKMEELRLLRSSNGRIIDGYSMLAITISIGAKPALPIAIFWHKKTEKESKIKIAKQTVCDWIKIQQNRYSLNSDDIVVCFDNWYLCQEISASINRLNVKWVSKLKSNWTITAEVSQKSYPVFQYDLWQCYWKITNIKVKDFFTNAFKPEKVFRIWHKSLGICYATESSTDNGIIWLVSNFDMKNKTMVKLYKLRWKIETIFRDLKQNMKIAATHFTSFAKNKFYMELKILVFSCLQLLKLKIQSISKVSIGEILNQIEIELSMICNNFHNLLIFLQLHIINKTQNPFEALCNKAL